MNIFLELLADRFELSYIDDDMICIDEDTVIFYSEECEKITFLCPCFPVPDDHASVVNLLQLNTQCDVNFCAADNIVLAKYMLHAEEAFEDLCAGFSFYIGEIFAVRNSFGYAPSR